MSELPERWKTTVQNLIDIADRASERSVTERVRAENAEAKLALVIPYLAKRSKYGDADADELLANLEGWAT